jgi:hypothetical protein
MIEAGGGLSLAIGMALSDQPESAPEASPDTPTTEAQTPRTATAAAPNAPTVEADCMDRTLPDKSTGPRTLALVTTLTGEILDRLRVSGGRTEGVRSLAAQLGRARSTVSDECHRLVATGKIAMTRGPRGTVLALTDASSPRLHYDGFHSSLPVGLERVDRHHVFHLPGPRMPYF